MRLDEASSKAILAQHGIAVPRSVVVGAGEVAPQPPFPGPWFVKALVEEGRRGLRGLVARAGDLAEFTATDDRIVASAGPVARLIEEAVAIEAERYLAIGVDAARFGPVLMVGRDGGVHVEESDTDGWATVAIDVARGLLPHDAIGAARTAGLSSPEARSIAGVAMKLWDAFEAGTDVDLVEINPLAWDGTGHVALDAKVRTYEDIEERRVIYFDRPGPVAVLSGGAGLGMAVADLLTELGTPPANFVDVAGGVTAAALAEMGERVFARTRQPGVTSLLMAISTSLTPIDGVLRSVLAALEASPPETPAVAYFASGAAVSHDADLFEQLRDAGIEVAGSLEEAIRRAAELSRRAA